MILLNVILLFHSVSTEEQERIEKATRGQSTNDNWRKYRTNRLTASNFGRVFKMRPSTECHNTVVSILYPDNIDHLPAIKYGKEQEEAAVETLNQILAQNSQRKVSSCGLFVDTETGFLAASPDGVIDEDTLVEIKCPLKCKEQSIKDLAIQDPTFCLNYEPATNKMSLKRGHNYYYQIQGQLHCAKR